MRDASLTKNFSLLSILCVALLSGCGAEPEDTENKAENDLSFDVASNWSSLMDQDPSTLTTQELNDAYWGYAVDKFGDSLAPAVLTPDSLRQFTDAFLGYPDLKSPYMNLEYIMLGAGEGSEQSLSCYPYGYFPGVTSGKVNLTGEITTDRISASFVAENCRSLVGEFNGEGYFRGDRVSMDSSTDLSYFDGNQYFKSLQLKHSSPITNSTHFVSGYVSTFDGVVADEPLHSDPAVEFSAINKLLYENEETGVNTIVIQSTTEKSSIDYWVPFYDFGKVAISNIGSAEIKFYPVVLNTDFFANDSFFDITGVNGAIGHIAIYTSEILKAELDYDGDGLVDVGRYYSSYEDFFQEPISDDAFFLPENMNHPPYFLVEPVWAGNDFTNGFDVDFAISNQSFTDPDSPISNLSIQCYWELNGVVLEGESSNSLPATYNYGYTGDVVKFYCEASDERHVTRSKALTYTF